MQPTGSPRDLTVVGRSGADAGATFGPAFEEALSTSYERFYEDVDLDRVRIVALGDDAALAAFLPGLLERRKTARFDVLVEVGPCAGNALAGLLAASPHTPITAVSHETGATVLHLGTESGGVSGEGVRVLLEALQNGSFAPWNNEADDNDIDESTSLPAWANSRRRRQALVAGAGLLVLGVLVLSLIGRSDAGSTGVLVTLGVTTVLAQGVLLVVTLMTLRRAAHHRVFDDQFKREMRQRTRRLLARGATAGDQMRGLALESARSRTWRDDEVGRESTRDQRSQNRHLQTERQVQALLNLDKLVKIEAVIPPMGGWAASPDLLVLCVQSLLEEKPRTLVECGSGISTLILALAAAQHDLPTRIVALEHDAAYARSTRRLLARHGMADRAEIRLAPLQPVVGLPGHHTPWYDASALSDLDEIGMLLVDGPPGATGPQARYPALPLLRERLSERCLIVMDDLNRAADRAVAERWNAEMDDFELEVIGELQKMVGLLSRP